MDFIKKKSVTVQLDFNLTRALQKHNILAHSHIIKLLNDMLGFLLGNLKGLNKSFCFVVYCPKHGLEFLNKKSKCYKLCIWNEIPPN